MPIDRVRIDQAIPRWIATHRRASASALKTKRLATAALLRAAAADGVLYVRDLKRHHFDAAFADLADGIGDQERKRRAAIKAQYRSKSARLRVETFATGGPRTGRCEATLVGDRRHLRQFVDYCKGNNWMANSLQPFSLDGGTVSGGDAPGREDAPEKRRVVRFNDWNRLLDTAGELHPRTRVLVAVGLLWGRRVSEAALLQWGHINLTDEMQDRSDLTLSYRAVEIEPGYVLIRNVKRRRTISIPVGATMREELTRWQDWVEKTAVGPVQPNWYVIPARVSAVKLSSVGASIWQPREWPVTLDRPAATEGLIKDVQKTLTKFGWRDVRGQGMHTLRRSVASHLDSIGELSAAQALLDHMHRSTTEGYSGNRAGESDLDVLMKRADPYRRPAAYGVPGTAEVV